MIGTRVQIEFGRGKGYLIGWVISVNTIKKPSYTLKPILKFIDKTPLLYAEDIRFIYRIAKYYHQPIYEIIASIMPTGILDGKDLPKTKTSTRPTPNIATLTPQQQQALASLPQTGFSPTILQGVTGSGKTEIYVEYLRKIIALGKKCLVLVPEIGLIESTLNTLNERLGASVAIYHSGMSVEERMHAFSQALHNEIDVLLGTRSAVFLLLPNMGCIVMDEEQDPSYKQQHDSSFNYHARSIALFRAHGQNCPILLCSATPSSESMLQIKKGGYSLTTLTERYHQTPLPQWQIVDMKTAEKAHDLLAKESLTQIQQELEQGHHVFIFLNQRGWAQLSTENAMIHCCQCSASLTYHRTTNQVLCHYCGENYKPNSFDKDWVFKKYGTEQIEALLHSLIQCKIVRIDSDSTTASELHGKLQSTEPTIFIGTQMLAKGHHIPNLNLAIMLNIDAWLFSSDFRYTEQLAQLLHQVAGRVGRTTHNSRIIIQSSYANHPLITQLTNEPYIDSMNMIMQHRKLYKLPPYAYMALLKAVSKDEQRNMQYLELLANSPYPVTTIGPYPAYRAKVAGSYHSILQITSMDRKSLHQTLSWAMAQNAPTGLSLITDIDPLNSC